MNQITDVVKHLLIINVLMFLGTMALGDIRSQLALYYPASNFFQPYQLVSHMFMHSDITHLAFNMYALFMFGTAIEALWGGRRFLIYYLATGFGAVILSLLVKYIEIQYTMAGMDPEIVQQVLSQGGDIIAQGKNYTDKTIGGLNRLINSSSWGASGAVFGLLAAYAMKFPNRKLGIMFLPIFIEAKYFVFIIAAIELFLGLGSFNTGIAHFAHLGGALFGVLIILYWQKIGTQV